MKLKPLTDVEQLFVVASMTRPEKAETGRDLELLHRNQGYSRIAVHYVIERSGNVYAGRPLTMPGVLAGKRNTSTIQVCLLGGVDDAMRPADNFTELQIKALGLLAEKHDLPIVFAPDFPQGVSNVSAPSVPSGPRPPPR